jgi:hypothetical protein
VPGICGGGSVSGAGVSVSGGAAKATRLMPRGSGGATKVTKLITHGLDGPLSGGLAPGGDRSAFESGPVQDQRTALGRLETNWALPRQRP